MNIITAELELGPGQVASRIPRRGVAKGLSITYA